MNGASKPEEMLDIAKFQAPAHQQNGVLFIGQDATEAWLRACAAGSTPIVANVCLALANAVAEWKATA